ncbi:MAG: ATP-binding protein, partial [Candidatus Zixiibacteriota bacterium]
HVNMVLEVDNELGMVTIDSGMIQQTIVNLIYNAADALNEDGNQGARGEVTIRTQKLKTGRALIAVSDNGPGVPEEKRETLFTERFTTKPKGHGIGLITCAKIIEAHSGRISYEEGPQGGASFVIEIPLRQPEMTRTDTQPLALGPKSPRRTLPARS